MASGRDSVSLKPKSTQHYPVQLAHLITFQICVTNNAAYHFCQEDMPHCNVHSQTKGQGAVPRENSLHSTFSYWFQPFDCLGINKVIVNPGCELGTHLDKTSDTTRKASRLQGH